MLRKFLEISTKLVEMSRNLRSSRAYFYIFFWNFGQIFDQIFGQILDQIFGQIFDQVFDQIFDQVFDQKYSVQFYSNPNSGDY